MEVGNGEKLFTLGQAELILDFGDGKNIKKEFFVLDTTAFEAVLGMDFLKEFHGVSIPFEEAFLGVAGRDLQ